jgi:hypothetical protein
MTENNGTKTTSEVIKEIVQWLRSRGFIFLANEIERRWG